MVRHASQMDVEYSENMRGGVGRIKKTHILHPEELQQKGRLFSTLTLPTGASIGSHTHNGEVEAYYVLQGQGLYHEGDWSATIGPGDVSLVENGGNHSIENIGEGDLVLLAVILFAD